MSSNYFENVLLVIAIKFVPDSINLSMSGGNMKTLRSVTGGRKNLSQVFSFPSNGRLSSEKLVSDSRGWICSRKEKVQSIAFERLFRLSILALSTFTLDIFVRN